MKCTKKISKKNFLFAMLIMTSITIFGCHGNQKKGTVKAMSDKPKEKIMSIEERVADAKNRRGEHYAKRLELFIKDIPQRQAGGIVFVGDSITEGFPTDCVFPKDNVINRGIGGDKVTGVTERIDVSVKDLKPKKIYLMIGINNILWIPDTSIEELAKEYEILVAEIKKVAPNAELNIQSVLPLSGQFANKNDVVDKFNELIKKIAKNYSAQYIDLQPALSDSSGLLRSDFTADGLHLNLEGYMAWMSVILNEDELFEAAVAMAPKWKERYSTSHKIDAIDPSGSSPYPGNRGPEQLIIYTPNYNKPRTGTNEWGNEAVVQNGVVIKIAKNNSEIPKDGFVISGHNTAGQWILKNLDIGVPVEYKNNELKIGMIDETKMSPRQKYNFLRGQFFEALLKMKTNNNLEKNKEAAKTLFQKIQKADKPEISLTEEDFKKLRSEIENFK